MSRSFSECNECRRCTVLVEPLLGHGLPPKNVSSFFRKELTKKNSHFKKELTF